MSRRPLVLACLAATALIGAAASTSPPVSHDLDSTTAPPPSLLDLSLRPPSLPPATAQWEYLRTDGTTTATAVRPLTAQPRITPALIPQYRSSGQARVFRERPAGFVPAAIVMHGTGGGAPGSGFGSVAQLHRFFARPGSRAASHYGIDRDGRIMQFVATSEAAFHVATPGWNDISIGIELLNDNSGTDPYPQAQLDAASRLVRWLATTYDIPLEAIVRHRDVQPSDRSDPVGFPWVTWKAGLAP